MKFLSLGFEIRTRHTSVLSFMHSSAMTFYISSSLFERLFVKRFGEELTRKTPRWESRLGRLLKVSRENKKIPEETLVYQLFSLKWLRNAVAHPSEYRITGEDVRLGLVSIMYLLQQTNSYNLI